MVVSPRQWSQRSVGRWIARFALVWALTLCAMLLAMQQYTHYHLPIARHVDITTDGISSRGSGDGSEFRFSAAYVSLRLPGLSHVDHVLSLRVHNEMQEPRTLSIATDTGPVATMPLRRGWQNLAVLIPATALSRSADTSIILETQMQPGQTRRTAGLPIARLDIDQRQAGGLPRELLLSVLAAVTLLEIVMLLAGMPWLESLAIDSLLLAAVAFVIGNWRIETAVALPMVLWTLAEAVALAALARVLIRAQSSQDRFWRAQAIAAAVGLFVVHAAGMQAPQFIDIDHLARAHSVIQIAGGNGAAVQAKLGRQHEWGLDSVPYSLLSYYVLVPLAWLMPQADRLNQAVKAVVSLIDATVPLMLYRLVRAEGASSRAAGFAALLYAALPVTHIYFHDGSYPTILGTWCAVLAVLAFAQLVRHSAQPGFWRALAISIATLAGAMLMYVTQFVFLPVVAGGAALSALLLGTPIERRGGWRLVFALLCAVVFALVVFYGLYIWQLVVDIGAQLISGARPGHDSGDLSSPLVGSFAQQAWGHARWLPLPLAIIGLVLAIRRRQRGLAFVGLGYALLFVSTSLVDPIFSLWNKHWYFALPGLAVLAALALDRSASYGRVARLVVAVVLLFLVWESLAAWGGRVFFYDWSLRTL